MARKTDYLFLPPLHSSCRRHTRPHLTRNTHRIETTASLLLPDLKHCTDMLRFLALYLMLQCEQPKLERAGLLSTKPDVASSRSGVARHLTRTWHTTYE